MLTKSHHNTVERKNLKNVGILVADSVLVLHKVHIYSVTGFGHA